MRKADGKKPNKQRRIKMDRKKGKTAEKKKKKAKKRLDEKKEIMEKKEERAKKMTDEKTHGSLTNFFIRYKQLPIFKL
jgi:hypothetical protein